MLRRHPNKNKPWIVRKYYIACGPSKWNFHAKIKDEKGNNTILYLYHASKTSIKRHIKIKSAAKLYDPKFKDYFKHRESISKTRTTSDRCSSEAELRMNY